MNILYREVTVCDHCLTASCWHGTFMCDRARGAGTVQKSVDELRRLKLENPEYWFKNPNTGAINQHDMAAYEAATQSAKDSQHGA